MVISSSESASASGSGSLLFFASFCLSTNSRATYWALVVYEKSSSISLQWSSSQGSLGFHSSVISFNWFWYYLSLLLAFSFWPSSVRDSLRYSRIFAWFVSRVACLRRSFALRRAAALLYFGDCESSSDSESAYSSSPISDSPSSLSSASLFETNCLP